MTRKNPRQQRQSIRRPGIQGEASQVGSDRIGSARQNEFKYQEDRRDRDSSSKLPNQKSGGRILDVPSTPAQRDPEPENGRGEERDRCRGGRPAGKQ